MPFRCLFKLKTHLLFDLGAVREGALLALQLQSKQSLL